MARRRRRSTYKRRRSTRRRSTRRRSPSTRRRSYRKRRSSSCRKSNTGYGYSYSAAACAPCGPYSPYSWPSSQKKNDLCNPCNPCSPYSMYNFAGTSSPFPKIEYPKIKLKGKNDKDEEKEFSIDPMTFSMYANYYKGCLPKCGPC